VDLSRDFDHLEIQGIEDPFPLLAEARERCPVTRSSAHDGFVSLFKYSDIVQVAHDPTVFSSAEGTVIPAHADLPQMPPIECDPPLHMQFRRPLLKPFSPANVATLEPVIRSMTVELIDQFIEEGRADLAADLATPLPAYVIAHVMDIPDEDRDQFRGWGVSAIRNPDDFSAFAEMIGYFSGVYNERTTRPHNPFVDLVLAMEIDGRPIDETEFVCLMNMLALAGLDTTASAMQYMLLLLGTRPTLLGELLSATPEAIELAVDEFLRFISPVPSLSRTATTSATIQSLEVEKGERVLLNWISANHDPDEFQDPEQLVLDRSPNRHIAFGIGIHRCLGMHLARLELRILLEEVLAHIPKFEVADEPISFYSGMITRCIRSIPATFPAGTRSRSNTPTPTTN
jgi:cytochrome P450